MIDRLPINAGMSVLTGVTSPDATSVLLDVFKTVPDPDWVPFWPELILQGHHFDPNPIGEWLITNGNPKVIAKVIFDRQFIDGPDQPPFRSLWFCKPDAWVSLSEYLGRLTGVDYGSRLVITTFIHKTIMIDPRNSFPFPGQSWLTSWLDSVKNGTDGLKPDPLIVYSVGISTYRGTWHLASGPRPYIDRTDPDATAEHLQSVYFGTQS